MQQISNPSISHRRMQSVALLFAVALMVGFAALLGGPRVNASPTPAAHQSGRAQPGQPDAVRIGIYDSRAVAVAYIRSDAMSEKMQSLMLERSDAEKRGDAKRIDELNALGASMQIRFHLQGFSTAPVDDILETVRDELPRVAEAADVVIITRAVDFAHPGAGVELVDVTDQLVALFNPDELTLKSVREIRTQKPEPIERIAQMPAVK